MNFWISWATSSTCATGSRQSVPAPPDLVVGIVRGGLPVAVALSHLWECPSVGVLDLRRTASNVPFTLRAAGQVEGEGAFFPDGAFDNVVIVDDIIATGEIMSVDQRRIVPVYPHLKTCTFAALPIDRAKVAALGFIDSDQCRYGIDNSATWIVLPWERSP